MLLPHKILQTLNLKPSKARGQNFLHDPNIINKIVALILHHHQNGETVLEIGSGLGAITLPLLKEINTFLAVEYDRGLANYLRNNDIFQGLNLIEEDILKVNLIDLAKKYAPPFFVVGNLPYNLSSPILFWLLEAGVLVNKAIFMLQKEVAERFCALPDTKAYGRLAIALSLGAEVKLSFDVPPGAFYPRPKVESQMIEIIFNKGYKIDFKTLGKMTMIAFSSRRKTIFNNLAPYFGKDESLLALEKLSINPQQRPATISPNTFWDLAKILLPK